jgi:hypothetical protein
LFAIWLDNTLFAEALFLPSPANSFRDTVLRTELSKFFKWGKFFFMFSNSIVVQGPTLLSLGILNLFPFPVLVLLLLASSSSSEESDDSELGEESSLLLAMRILDLLFFFAGPA